MSKMIELEKLNRLAKALDNRTTTKIELETERSLEVEQELRQSLLEMEAALETVDAISLNGYKIWVGTSEELNQIEERDENTLYFEINNGSTDNEEVYMNHVVNGVLTLTTNKYQKSTSIIDGTQIVFPEVSTFTEIHLFFTTDSDMNLIFPECKWRLDSNIEKGKSYEIVCTYNTIEWLVNVIVYS